VKTRFQSSKIISFMYKIKISMTLSLSPHRSPRNHPAHLVRNAMGETARNVTNDFATPLDQNAVLAAVTDIVPNISVTATAPSSIINNAHKTYLIVMWITAKALK
jgi:hypothetical protein